MKKSTGITPRTPQACITTSSQLWDIRSEIINHLPASLFSSGSKVDQVPALNSVLSQKSDQSESKTALPNSSTHHGTSSVICSSSINLWTLVSHSEEPIVKARNKLQAPIKLPTICWTSWTTFTRHGHPWRNLHCTSLENHSVATTFQLSPEIFLSTKHGELPLRLNSKVSASVMDGLIQWTKSTSMTHTCGL